MRLHNVEAFFGAVMEEIVFAAIINNDEVMCAFILSIFAASEVGLRYIYDNSENNYFSKCKNSGMIFGK